MYIQHQKDETSNMSNNTDVNATCLSIHHIPKSYSIADPVSEIRSEWIPSHKALQTHGNGGTSSW